MDSDMLLAVSAEEHYRERVSEWQRRAHVIDARIRLDALSDPAVNAAEAIELAHEMALAADEIGAMYRADVLVVRALQKTLQEAADLEDIRDDNDWAAEIEAGLCAVKALALKGWRGVLARAAWRWFFKKDAPK